MSHIKGKIVRIVSEHMVVLDAGEEKGVEPGMKFVIYADAGEITDPLTNEKLGNLEIPKGEVLVSIVHEKYSVAETETQQRSTPLGEMLRTLGTLSLADYETHKSLNVKKEDVVPLPEGIFMVKIGDSVRSVEHV